MSLGNIGVIGLGAIGSGVALNLCKFAKANGVKVYLWNRSSCKVDGIVKAYSEVARACSSPEEVSRNSSVVFLYLFDGKTTQEILSGAVFPFMEKNSIVVNGCTMEPEWAGEFFNFAIRQGLHYVSAPVFGRPDVAAAGKLVVAISGPNAEVKGRIRPLLNAISREVLDVGSEPPNANHFKLCGNFLIASCIEVSSEAMGLAKSSRLNPKDLVKLISALFPNSPMAGYAALIEKGAFDSSDGGFSVKGGLKDVNLMKQMQDKGNVYAPTLDTVRSHLEQANNAGNGDKDWTCISKLIIENKRAK